MGRKWLFAMALLAGLAGAGAGPVRGQDLPPVPDPAAAIAAPPPAVPRDLPTSAFVTGNALAAAKLSGDGALVAFSMVQGGITYVLIHDAASRARRDGIALPEKATLNWFRWAGSQRLLLSVNGGSFFVQSRLYLFDLARDELVPLQLPRMAFDADAIVHVDPAGGFVLASIAEAWLSPPAVWRFDLGAPGIPEAVEVQPRENRVGLWLADETGTVRIGIGVLRNGRLQLRYRADGQSPWVNVDRIARDDEDRQYWDFIGLRAGSSLGLALVRPDGSERQIVQEFDFATGTPGTIVHALPDADVAGLVLDQANATLGLVRAGDSDSILWLDAELQRHAERLRAALPGSAVEIVDIAADRSRMLVLQSGPGDPGALYVYTPGARQLDLFAELRPQLAPALLSPGRALTYLARDGTPIRAMLTVPRGLAEQGLPLVVYPHGGPYGVRDQLDYDDTVQLLASRGYAVVQPNYRGSAGYGRAFEEAGEGQIGRAMQDDLDDAVRHLVEAGIADPARVCIVGASYGGFAAMWGAIRNPEIYRCAASWAGVTHYDRQLQHDRRSLWFGADRRQWREQVEGDTRSFDLDDVSPAVQVARLTRPLLLAHGRRDGRVPFSQFELMQDRAERAGVALETLVLEQSGHAFSGPDEQQAWYDALLAFLDRHNPAARD